MSSIGRIIAGARDLSVGGPLGSLLVRAARSVPSRLANRFASPRPRDPKRSIAFTIAVIALGAKMAKADGTVSRDEVAAFREVFQVPPGEEAHLRLVFDLARRSTAGFDSYARQVGRLFAGHRAVLEDLLGGLFYIALADGRVCPAEDAYLREVARHLGFDPAGYARIRAAFVGRPAAGASPGDDDPHAVLGLAPDASLDEIRAAYRRLIRAHHPDLLVARGMPAERVALATQRVARINAARDRLLRHRGGAAEAQPA
ncbi:MAG TPA: TerB family tellurite resistance protein [Stellaceae bacterium]